MYSQKTFFRAGAEVPVRPNEVPSSSFSLPTTRFERILLIAITALIPLENNLPVIAGFSSIFFIFALLAIYVICNRKNAFARVWLHPVFLVAYAMLLFCSVDEVFHPDPSYSQMFQITQMFAGAMLIASICRDHRALLAGIYGYVLAGFWMSLYLFLTVYGALSGTTATGFTEASHIREGAFSGVSLETNLNAMAIVAAQGAIVALALALKALSLRQRYLFTGLAALCLVGSFLPFSRSGVVIVALSCGAVLLAYGASARVVLLGFVLGIGTLVAVPDAVFARLTYSTEVEGGKMEARAKVYTAAVENLPEYFLGGVGTGNFYGEWGRNTGWYFEEYESVIGPHNCYIAMTVYWGVGGLVIFMCLLWQAYRCVPRRLDKDVLALALIGLSTSLLLLTFVSHILYNKMFSVGLGLLVGSQRWVWPPVAKLKTRMNRQF
jgi:hypothetical protein